MQIVYKIGHRGDHLIAPANSFFCFDNYGSGGKINSYTLNKMNQINSSCDKCDADFVLSEIYHFKKISREWLFIHYLLTYSGRNYFRKNSIIWGEDVSRPDGFRFSIFLNGPHPASFCLFSSFFSIPTMTNEVQNLILKMVCLGFECWTAGWKAQTNPLSYGGPSSWKFWHHTSVVNVINICGGNINFLKSIK